MNTIDQNSDVSYSVMAYQNVEVTTNTDSGTHPRISATSNTDICFQVLDLSNANMDGTDGSFNVLAEFKIHSKFNDSNLVPFTGLNSSKIQQMLLVLSQTQLTI